MWKLEPTILTSMFFSYPTFKYHRIQYYTNSLPRHDTKGFNMKPAAIVKLFSKWVKAFKKNLTFDFPQAKHALEPAAEQHDRTPSHLTCQKVKTRTRNTEALAS